MSTPRVAIVTGASAGIGLAIARNLTQLGHRVVINARREDRLKAIAKELGEDRVACVAGDCSSQPIIDRLFSTAVSRFAAPADLVVVNAGRGLNGSVLTSDVAQWDEMIRTNVLAAALLIRSAGEHLTAQVPADQTGIHGSWTKRARDIIIIGSVVGRHVSPFSSMYGATKFAVHGLAEGARRELAPKGVRVTLIEPGFVVSEFQQVAGYEQAWFDGVKDRIGPVLEPDDVARCVSFVAQQPAHVHVSDVLLRPTRQDYP